MKRADDGAHELIEAVRKRNAARRTARDVWAERGLVTFSFVVMAALIAGWLGWLG